MSRSNRVLMLVGLLGVAVGALGGTCVVVEEGPPGSWDGPGDNADVMEEQQEEIVEETDR